jgi:hypothetical protein
VWGRHGGGAQPDGGAVDDPGMARDGLETSARACFDWAGRVGSAWRTLPGVQALPDAAAPLLSVAFGERPPHDRAAPQAHARCHDRAIGVGVVLSGLSAGGIERRARRQGRTAAFAEGAARAAALGDRDPHAFRLACRLWRSARLEWEEGVAAGLGGWSDPSRGPIFQRGRRLVRRALLLGETWAVVARLRADAARSDGFADGALDRVDLERLVEDASYRAGAARGARVLAQAGRRAVTIELSCALRRRA